MKFSTESQCVKTVFCGFGGRFLKPVTICCLVLETLNQQREAALQSVEFTRGPNDELHEIVGSSVLILIHNRD